MYLKSLTLKGFKSFASATTLHFEPGITAIVGPNGSGKSNIVDALSWVMGEQGVKSLRGGKMEDVIFAGTSGRAPLGRAEVTLTIDNTDGVLPIDYSEVTISRTLFRSGGSEYAINGQTVRLLDVAELLSDTGMGREMHVIVGQGQLDAILTANPEQRRVFIEEAAGVLKHRKRKEKATRKLDSTQANIARLNDLIAEIRRQLRPLGRQAEVARKAAVVQAELRDAKARLLADELVTATEALEADLADEQQQAAAKTRLTHDLELAQTAEAAAELVVAQTQPLVTAAQEAWYALSALSERVSTTTSIAAERMRHISDEPKTTGSRDPEELDRDAAKAREEETKLRSEGSIAEQRLTRAQTARNEAEVAHSEAEKQYAAQLRAVADRREGLARLTGQVNSLKSRLGAMDEEQSRLAVRLEEAKSRATSAERDYTALETQIASAQAGEIGLDADFEAADERLNALTDEQEKLREAEVKANQQRASLAARVEALGMGLERGDGAGALLVAGDELQGLLGAVATLIQVPDEWQTAVAAALGTATEAVAVSGVTSAVEAFALLKDGDLGRAGLLLGDAPADDDAWPKLPSGHAYLFDLITVEKRVQPAMRRLLRKMVAVDDLDAAAALIAKLPDVTAVTRDGDLLSTWFASGGSASKPSLLEVQAAYDEANANLEAAQHEVDRLRFALAEHAAQTTEARAVRDAALDRLNESDATLTAIAERLSALGQAGRAARTEAERLEASIAASSGAREADQAALAELEARLEMASTDHEAVEPDPSERDRLAAVARLARGEEMDARLALRTVEERMRASAGRADALVRAAANERAARQQALQRAAQLRREAEVATSVHAAAVWLKAQVETARTMAGEERTTAEAARVAAEQRLAAERTRARELGKQLDNLVEGAHRDEMARIEQRMRIEQLEERGISTLGLSAEVLMTEYGPHVPIPVLTRPDGSALTEDDETPEPIAYDRDAQLKRLRTAEGNLAVLGRVNPLALEEFDAMSERHAFLAEQFEDLKRTRKDLLDIIDEVDNRVQEVFTSAYADVEKTFKDVFARLFPGGEGKLVLTDPDDMLVTGIDVEARPAGKKVKRLSLLSGGERSLVAVAFLLSLFIARPSPFYILDEVEAALDDTNLGRLLEIYADLGANSQLLMITHQKRTMEIADALYGVTMRGDGVSTVISQRLKDE